MAPLSVQSFSGGKIQRKSVLSANIERRRELAATPPPATMVFIPVSSTALNNRLKRIFTPGRAATGSDRKKATETPSPQTCWLSQLYLYSRSLLVTPGAVHRADRGRGAPSPARLRTYGGRKGPGGGAAGDRREPHPFPTCPRRPGEKQRPPSPPRARSREWTPRDRISDGGAPREDLASRN